ncbi:MAG: U3 snoRNP protein [Marteilia pararefringens]
MSLELDVTPENFDRLLKVDNTESLKRALIVAIKLNDLRMLESLCLKVGLSKINMICFDLTEDLIFELIDLFGRAILNSSNIQLLLTWLIEILSCHYDLVLKVSRLKRSAFASHLIHQITQKNMNIKPIESDLINRWKFLKNQKIIKDKCSSEE